MVKTELSTRSHLFTILLGYVNAFFIPFFLSSSLSHFPDKSCNHRHSLIESGFRFKPERPTHSFEISQSAASASLPEGKIPFKTGFKKLIWAGGVCWKHRAKNLILWGSCFLLEIRRWPDGIAFPPFLSALAKWWFSSHSLLMENICGLLMSMIFSPSQISLQLILLPKY